jgi:outer membrane protein assembly factor BamA
MAQTAAFEGKPIVDIQFPNGQPLDPADLSRAMPLRNGQPLHSIDVAHAIDGLFATGRFNDIVVEAEPSGQGVVLRIVTQNALFLGGITVDGRVVESPNRAQVESAAQLSLGAPFHDDDVTEALDRIHTLLQSNGFYDAVVTPAMERDDDAQQIFLTFRVQEGKRAKYDTPAITGATKLPDSTIVQATGWRFPIIRRWRHVSAARTRGGAQGVLNKYGAKNRLMARVDLKNLDYDAKRRRVHPHLEIDAGPTVQVTAVETKVSRRVLKRYVPVFQERAVDNDLLETGRRNLREYFQSQGFYDVSVDFKVQPVRDDQETVEYAISRGTRYKLVQVTIAGNRYFDRDSIRERMFMQPASFLILRHGRYSEAFRRRDEESIANLYKSNGFRDAQVTSEVTRDVRGHAGSIAVTIHINEGPQWVVDELAIHGASQFKPQELPSLASSKGQPFAEVNIANDRETMLTFYYTRGFPKATFTASWQIPQPGHASVVYTITEGDREYVRDVLVSGLKTTRQSMVDRLITLKAGDPLSPTAQTNIQKSLYDLDVFERGYRGRKPGRRYGPQERAV